MSKWDVYRDRDGKPVTLTEQQCAAIRHAARVWAEVTAKEGYKAAERVAEISAALNDVNLFKSCLMGRMLYEGRPPLDEAPPTVNSAPAYHLRDPDLCPQCGGERTAPGRSLSVSLVPPLEFSANLMLVNGGELPGKTITRTWCAEDWHPL